ncbi:MAG: hypothetical protein V9E96_14275 [Chitinophagaceae bacterium]
MLKELLLLPLTLLNRNKAIKAIESCIENRIFLFDIDNTIADTIPSFENYSNLSEAKRVSSLAFFIKMHKLIRILKKSPNNKIIFLTARGFRSNKVTKKWLLDFGFNISNDEFFIVRKADEKIKIIKALHLNCKQLYVIDDLSYLKKTGEVMIYDKLVIILNKLSAQKKLKYYGINEIMGFIYKN